jgi:hypothetical protein
MGSNGQLAVRIGVRGLTESISGPTISTNAADRL